MICLADWNACPVGCGVGLIFLKALETNQIFLFCSACELAFETVPDGTSPIADTQAEILAPRGISIPSRNEIESIGWGGKIAEERPEVELESDLWWLRATTLLEGGEIERAIILLTGVIQTWHAPPKRAYSMRADAYRRLGLSAPAAIDDFMASKQTL